MLTRVPYTYLVPTMYSGYQKLVTRDQNNDWKHGTCETKQPIIGDMKTCALAPLNKADTFFGGNGGASSSQKCHHNYYTAAAVHSSLKSGKKGEKFEDVQKNNKT